ncbi:TetR/AcrR family transcriptional regulator [Primorskyibacter sp. 2E107]|uniref:TetR/AcrR family transcriptional regulator n=1 Tax=Primorskyibacter sp. 2E107 TaxID=3403458 RepID=UPI003AF98420
MSRKSDETRKKILQATWTLLESGKSGAVRMSDIAKEAGISRQALYLHYPNRADLLIAVTRYIDEAKAVDAQLAESRKAQGAARLDAYIAAWGGYIPEIYGVGRALMAMADSDAEAREAWTDRMAAMRHGCAAAVAALEEAGLLAEGLEKTEATDLLWTLLSVRNWEQLRHGCGWTQAAYIAGMTRAARRMLMDQP